MALATSFRPRSSYVRKLSQPLPLPEPVAWLAHVSLGLAARSVADFELGVHFNDDKHEASWTLRRSFDNFRALQKRLLRALQPGHACHAECAWLYAVVKKHFPKRSLLPVKPAERQRALLQVLTTLQASLLNRGNHGCSVLMHKVAREFNDFLAAGAMRSEASFASYRRDSLSSLTSNDEDDSLELSDAHEFDSDCACCRHSLDCQDPSARAADVCCVIAAFSCGHQFHVACLEPVTAGAAPRCTACSGKAQA